MAAKSSIISDYFQLHPVKSAKVSEISEATAGSSVPEKDRVNFHIGHPVQDKNLSRSYFRLVSSLDALPSTQNLDKDITYIEDAGWERSQLDDIRFIYNTVDRSTPYLPRGGYSSSSSSSALSPSGNGQLKPAALAWVTYSLTVLGEIEQLWAMARCVSPTSYFKRSTSSIFRMDNLFWDILSSFFVFEKRMPYLFSIIQRRLRERDRHGQNQ